MKKYFLPALLATTFLVFGAGLLPPTPAEASAKLCQPGEPLNNCCERLQSRYVRMEGNTRKLCLLGDGGDGPALSKPTSKRPSPPDDSCKYNCDDDDDPDDDDPDDDDPDDDDPDDDGDHDDGDGDDGDHDDNDDGDDGDHDDGDDDGDHDDGDDGDHDDGDHDDPDDGDQGNNGHGNDTDGNDDSNDADDSTDEDGTPGNSGN